MELNGKVAVVTGGGSGIGKALVERFDAEGAAGIVAVDLNEANAKAVAATVGGTGVGADVSDEEAIKQIVADTEANYGSLDLFVSNAGYGDVGGLEAGNEHIDRMFDVHVKSHIYAARAAIPGMVERGGGYFLNTASAAGLLTQFNSVAYTVSKAAAVAFAEWLAITYGNLGIGVSCLCPQAVETNILANSPMSDQMTDGPGIASEDGVMQPEELADTVIECLRDERFLVLPHPEVETYVKRKADDRDRWLRGMRRFQETLYEGQPSPAQWFVG